MASDQEVIRFCASNWIAVAETAAQQLKKSQEQMKLLQKFCTHPAVKTGSRGQKVGRCPDCQLLTDLLEG